MSLRKIAALLAAFGLMVGLIGTGVGAQFTDQVIAQENINVGTFSCEITDASGGAVIAPDHKSVVYDAGTIMSSAPGSAPFSFAVKNTGTIPEYLKVTAGPVLGTNAGPFSSLAITPAAFVSPVNGGAIQAFGAGLQWTELSSAQLGQPYTINYTVSCGEASVIFDNHPATLPSNLPSWGPEAYAYNEWGGGVTFAGSARKLDTATVTMSSWACQTGGWNTNDCVSTPGATFNVDITFNLYNVAAGNTVGTLITTQTRTFAIPYRPSYDSTHCAGTGRWYDGSSCFNGKAADITFIFPGTDTLPNNAIFGITFNTDHFGYTHIGGTSSPTDSLNIATYPGTDLDGLTPVAALVGAWLPDDVHTYMSTGSTPTTFIGSGPVTSTGGFGPFGSLMPAVQITASN